MRWHSAELAGTFWAVVLNGLLAEQPEQPLPWLGAWPSAALLWVELTGVEARYVVSKLRTFRNLKPGCRTHHPAKKTVVLHGLSRHSFLMQCLLRLLSSVRISLVQC